MFELFERIMNKGMEERFIEACQEECKIVIQSDKKGGSEVNVEGTALAILINLAGATENILNTLQASEEIYEFIRNCVKTRKEGSNE